MADSISELADREHVVLVDKTDRVLGLALKAEVHTDHTPLHRAFSLFLFDSRNRLLLQQRAACKPTWPLVWSNSCCGHPRLGEEITAAATRRSGEELGVHCTEPTVVLPHFRYRAELDGVVEHELCPVLVGRVEGVPGPDRAEVAAVAWWPWSSFLELVTSRPTSLTPWCVLETRELVRSAAFAAFLHTTDPSNRP
ncbi:MAG: isopentenyl-diphosphate delta-isomerase [Deltaproteobacteria bacterium RIFOXYA12_FULL_61_11]|nr:MAG: isopentenyl-diphosphate delta-isomerase [Deltaproteobacteria bacterium RIFOXYA12_FULL_61_11]